VDTRHISMPTQLDSMLADNSIVVAVNGGTSGWEALDWAAAEAAARRSPLRIVHVVVPLAAMFDPLGGTGPIWADPDASEAGALVLDEAVRRARQIAPDSTVTTSLTCGTLSAAIRAAGRDQALTVIGRSRPRRLGIAAASLRIARRAAGPVAIVRLDGRRHSGSSAGRVVLGIDDAAGPPAAGGLTRNAGARVMPGLNWRKAPGEAGILLVQHKGRYYELLYLGDIQIWPPSEPCFAGAEEGQAGSGFLGGCRHHRDVDARQSRKA